MRAQILELALLLHACGDVGYAHQPGAWLAPGVDCVEIEGIVRGFKRAVGHNPPDFDILERIRLGGVKGQRGVEQPRHESAHRAQSLGGDQRREQFIEADVAEVLAAEHRGERGRHLRLHLVLGVEQKHALHAALQNGVGQPIAGADDILLLALMPFDGNEHINRVPNGLERGLDGCHSLRAADYNAALSQRSVRRPSQFRQRRRPGVPNQPAARPPRRSGRFAASP